MVKKYLFKPWAVACVCALMGMGHAAQADVLLIDSVSDANSRHLPRTGLLMDQVLAEWGQPESKQAAVGSPPITRWDFPEFSVYFEYDHVISSVLHKGEVLKDR